MKQKKTYLLDMSHIHTFFLFLSNVRQNILIIAFFIVPITSVFVAGVALLVSNNVAPLVKRLDAVESRDISIEKTLVGLQKSDERIEFKLDRITDKLIPNINYSK